MHLKNVFHRSFCTALEKDGWRITHDPYTLVYGRQDLYVNLGKERTLAAERGEEKIAVAMSSVVGQWETRDLELALGRFVLYRLLIRRFEPGRTLYVAIPEEVFQELRATPEATPIFDDLKLRLVTSDADKEEIVRWTI